MLQQGEGDLPKNLKFKEPQPGLSNSLQAPEHLLKKKIYSNTQLKNMKRKLLFIVATISIVFLSAYKIADEIINRLGIEQQTAQRYIINNLVGSFSTGPISAGYEGDPNAIFNQAESFQIPYAKLLPAVISGDKASAAKELCEYVKKYMSSEEFIKAYNERKEEALPLMIDGTTISTLRGSISVYGKNIRNYKTDTKYVAEQQVLLDADQKKLDAMLEAAKKPFPDKELWEKAYPADPTILVKKKLQDYLQLVATVDFTAKLTSSGNRAKFFNPVYEKKSLQWKACYRAGKEVNDVVTAFVKDWLKGEIIPKNKIKMVDNSSVQTGNNPAQPSGNSPTQTSSNNQNNQVQVNNPVSNNPADSSTTPKVKEKKSLFNKLKDKTKSVIKY